jgi:hypothetical protein
MQAQPYVTVPFQMPVAIHLAPGAAVSITAKAYRKDPYPQTLRLKAQRSGLFDARLTEPCGDRWQLLIDPKANTVSLMDAVPMPLDWAGYLTLKLMHSVCGLAAKLS